MSNNPVTLKSPVADPLARFEWEVAVGGYEWFRAPRGIGLRRQVNQPGPPRSYRPFTPKHAGLFETFAHLSTTEKVLAFVNQYGLLGAPLRREGTARPYEYLDFVGVRRPQRPRLDDDHCWMTQVVLMRKFLACAKLVHDSEDVVWTALRPQVNKALQETCAPRLDWNPDSADEIRFRLDWTPQSLLGALWLQAVRSVTRASRLQQCASCEQPIEISLEKTTGARADARFCSVACRMRAYRTRKTKARELDKRGWTPGRIAKHLDTKTATVRGWVKKSPQ